MDVEKTSILIVSRTMFQ